MRRYAAVAKMAAEKLIAKIVANNRCGLVRIFQLASRCAKYLPGSMPILNR